MDKLLAAKMHAAGASRWPTIALDEEDFARAIEGHVAASEQPEKLHAEDLYLAAACLQSNPEAHLVFEDEMMPSARVALLKMRSPPDRVSDVLQTLREQLLVGEPSRPPKLREYSGRGPLGRWLHVTAVRTHLNALCAQRAERISDDTALEDVVVAAGPDPELSHLKTHYRAEFKQAFERSMEALSPAEKNLLRYRFVDVLTIAAICKLTGQHKATVHRQLAQTCAKLANHIEQSLGATLKLPKHELGSIRRLVRSQLQLSLERMLR